MFRIPRSVLEIPRTMFRIPTTILEIPRTENHHVRGRTGADRRGRGGCEQTTPAARLRFWRGSFREIGTQTFTKELRWPGRSAWMKQECRFDLYLIYSLLINANLKIPKYTFHKAFKKRFNHQLVESKIKI